MRSVQGARGARALAGQQLEVVEQNGVKVLRVAGEVTPEPVPHPETKAPSTAHDTPTAEPPKLPHISEADRWLASLEHSLTPEEKAKLAKMPGQDPAADPRHVRRGPRRCARSASAMS